MDTKSSNYAFQWLCLVEVISFTFHFQQVYVLRKDTDSLIGVLYTLRKLTQRVRNFLMGTQSQFCFSMFMFSRESFLTPSRIVCQGKISIPHWIRYALRKLVLVFRDAEMDTCGYDWALRYLCTCRESLNGGKIPLAAYIGVTQTQVLALTTIMK